MTIKTIRMPAAMLAATLAALRSGKFEQGKGKLCTSFPLPGIPNRYCCLGVMQMAIDGETEKEGLPSRAWLESKGIVFRGETILTFEELAGTDMYWRAPYLPDLRCSAWEANDIGCTADGDRSKATRKTFAEIADAWEAAAEGY